MQLKGLIGPGTKEAIRVWMRGPAGRRISGDKANGMLETSLTCIQEGRMARAPRPIYRKHDEAVRRFVMVLKNLTL